MGLVYLGSRQVVRHLPKGVTIRTPNGLAICNGYSEGRDRIRLVELRRDSTPVERFYLLDHFDVSNGSFAPLTHRSADIIGRGPERVAREGGLI